jgi:hypothetical protein
MIKVSLSADVVGQNSSSWVDGVYHVSVARKTFDAMPGAARGEAGWADERRFDAELADELAGWKSHDLKALEDAL